MTTATSSGNYFALTPFIFFIGLFLASTCCTSTPISPIFLCLITLVYATLCIFPRKTPFNEKIDIFIKGSAHPTIISMCYVFIFSAIFTHIITVIGGVDTAISVGMRFIPPNLLLPGLFTVISIFATAIGSSMGAIAAFMPICIGIAQDAGFDPALMTGVVVSGAMLGDNLSIISDTTIAATQTIGVSMTAKFKTNILLVIPAFLLTVIILFYQNHASLDTYHYPTSTLSSIEPITVIPYILVFALALLGIDVIAVLIAGIFASMAIGIYNDIFTFTQGTNLLLEGILHAPGIQEVLILVLLIGGLSYGIEYNGGVQYIIHFVNRKIRTKAHAEIAIVTLIALINACISINTIAILITGPIAKKIGNQCNIAKERIASLLDIVACICQGILPYAAQLLLAASLADISTFSIIPHLYYQGFIALVIIISITRTALTSVSRSCA